MANLEDVQDLIQEILDNPKLKYVADRLRQEYHDEPILQTASQMQRLLPRQLVEAKRLMRNPAEYHYNYRQLFYQQAKLLENFTDDFSEQASFSSCYPCYRDMNDRQLRFIVDGLGGKVNGTPREDGFDITVASEVMAIFCLATSISDLKERLSRIVCAYTYDGKPVTAGEIGAAGAMTALLKDALDPNLVQTLENNPAIIHGGPFANIAHGCNSVLATKLSLSLADYTITEAGFGADLGAEKFLDIKCRYAGIAPSACVLVATVRALKSHGGVAKTDLNQPNLEAVKAGASNLIRHIDNLKNGFGLPVVVAINAFPTDTAEEQAYVEQVCAEQGVPCVLSEVFAKGGEGGKALAEKVLEILEDRPIQYTYPLEMPLKDKINAIATKIYRADGVNYSAAASKTLAELTEMGYGDLPVCIAKTQYSFSDNAKLTGAPTGFTMEVREVRLAAGAGFVVVICGNIMTMPGLPKKPAAVNIDVDADGKITGLF